MARHVARHLAAVWLAALGIFLALAGPVHAAETLQKDVDRLLDQGRVQTQQAQQALQRIEQQAEPGSARRREAMVARGSLLANDWKLDAAQDIARELEGWRPDAGGDAIARASALWLRAANAQRQENFDAATRLSEDALALLPADAPAHVRARHLIQLALSYSGAGRLDDSLRLALEAIPLADSTGTTSSRLTARSRAAYVYYQIGQIDRARQLCDESVSLAEASGDWLSLAQAVVLRAGLLKNDSDPNAQRRALAAAVGSARRAGAKAFESRFLVQLANLDMAANDPASAIVHAEQALALEPAAPDKMVRSFAIAVLGAGHLALGRLDKGRALSREAIGLMRASGQTAYATETLLEMATALEKAGAAAGAAQVYHEYRREADLIFRSATQQKLAAVQEQHDAGLRSTRLQLLERENRLKAEQLQQGALLQRMWLLLVVVFALLMVAVALLLRRVRSTNASLTVTNQLLQVQSERDPLTGLANRRHFQTAMQHLAPGGRIVGTACLIDVDHFKRINDSFGHATGDAVLSEVARRLTAALRDDDLVVRWGGEEFIAVMQAVAPEIVDTLVQRLLDAIGKQPVQHEGREIPVTVSIGFATFPMAPAQIAVAWERALRLVDTTMYLAKTHGRNRAYGVKLLHAGDEAGIDAVASALEEAWREGKVTLTLLHGPGQAEPASGQAQHAGVST